MKLQSHSKIHRLIQLAADGRLIPSQQQTLDAHLAACPECRFYAAELRALETQLASVSVTRLVPPASRQASLTGAIHKRYRRYQMNRQIFSTVGMLAALVVVAVLFFLFGRIVPISSSPAGAPTEPVVFGTPTATIVITVPSQSQPLRFFTRAESDQLPVQSWQLTPHPETPTPDPGWTFTLTVAEVEQLAGFDVLEPVGLPRLLNFQGASFDSQHNIVGILYSTGFVLLEGRGQFPDDCDLCGVVGASAEVETVQIGNAIGEYVVGVWNLTNNGPVWDPTPFLKTLRWQANGMSFELIHNPTHDPEAVTMDDLIAIAANVISPSTAVITPIWLPEGYTYMNSKIIDNGQTTCLYFLGDGDDAQFPSLVIALSQHGLPSIEQLRDPLYNEMGLDGKKIPLITETVQLGGAVGAQALFVESGMDPSQLCGGDRVFMDQALVWQADDGSFVLFSRRDNHIGAAFLTRLDMRRVAESITGVSTIEEDAIDPERMTDLRTAKAIAGFNFKNPTYIPGLNGKDAMDYAPFTHISFEQSGSARRIVISYPGSLWSDVILGTTRTLESFASLAPELYETVIVNGHPGLFSPGICWDENDKPFTVNCGAEQTLTWFEDNLEYMIGGFQSKETLLQIAGSMIYSDLTLAEAESMAGFDIKAPASVPSGYRFKYAEYYDEHQAIYLLYEGPDRGTGLNYFTISATAGVTDTLDAVYNTNPEYYERLNVRDQPAFYFQGCWDNGIYDRNCAGSQSLTWIEDGIEYSISGVLPNDIAKVTLIAIAESIP